jgi:hypothetical protein
MQELGITQVFARSPQAMARVERLAGTFQDRLVTELRHAAAATITEAQAVLEGFLPRFNTRFRVPAAQPESAYRPLDPALDLDAVLAFCHPRTVARDNTVKYRWRTLQLLPSPERTSFAGARVDVLERPDGDLSVRHHGEPIATRLAPPPAGCAPLGPNWPVIPITSGSSAVEVPAAPCPARPPMGQPMERRPTAPSTAARCDRRLRANSPAGRRSSRPNCKACHCRPLRACSDSRASPSATTSAPTAFLDAQTVPRHPDRNQSTLTESLLSWTDRIAALRQW